MATVNHKPPVTKVVVLEPAKVTLEMSLEEAGVLLTIMNRIGGDPGRSARGYADSISNALCEVEGIREHLIDEKIEPWAQAIHFKTY